MVGLVAKPLGEAIAIGNVVLREVTLSDAAFIVQLRTQPLLSANIHATASSVLAQEQWLSSYFARERDYYFVGEDREGHALGTIRIPEVGEDFFEVGSWVFCPEAPAGAAVQALFGAYWFGFERLGKGVARFDVRLANSQVWRFHESYGAERIRSDGLDAFYLFTRPTYLKAAARFARLLKAHESDEQGETDVD